MNKLSVPDNSTPELWPILIDPIPVVKVEPPYDDTVSMLQRLDVEIYRDFDPDLVHNLLSHCLYNRNTVLHWVVKLKWDRKHKIPGKQPHVRAAKPFGQIAYCLLELCIQVHAGVGYKVASYPDAAVWFRNVWIDCLRSEIIGMIRLIDQGEGKKAHLLAEMRYQAGKLRNHENPYDPEQQPYLHHLIECSLRLVRLENFRKQHWLPYIRALTNCATQIQNNPNGYYQVPVVRVEQQNNFTSLRVFWPLGRGKGLECMFEKEVILKTPSV